RIETGMHAASINRIGVDAANRFLVTASDDKTVHVWELPAGRLLRIIRVPIGEGNEGKLDAVAISPDGSTIAAGGWTSTDGLHESIYLFDRESGRLIRRLGGLPIVVLHLVYSSDGRYLAATLFGKNGVRVFSTATYAPAGEDRDYGDSSYGADFDRADKLVTTSLDGFIRLYATGRDGSLRLLAKQKVTGGQQPHDVKFSPDGSRIAVGFFDSTKVAVVQASDLAPLYAPDTTGVNNGNLFSVAWSADGRTLYAGGMAQDANYNRFIRTWADGGRGGYRDIAGAANTIMHILPLRDGGIVYGASDPSFGVIDASGNRKLFTSAAIADYRALHQAFLLSPDGTGVGFAYQSFGKLPARFSLTERKLDGTSGGEPNWRPPETEDNNLHVTDWLNTYSPKLNGTPLKLKQHETSRSLALAPDRSAFLLGTEFSLRLFDRNGAERWRVAVPSVAWAVNISADGRVAVAACGDGTIRWYRMTDGKELLAFFPHADRKRWVAWTPEGYYDASAGAEELIGWHVNNGKDQAADFYPIGQFFEKFYHPKLLAQVLTPEGVQPPTANVRNPVNITKELKRPPLVSITSPNTGASFNTDTVQINVEATDQGGGVEDVRLYQNGKLVSDETRQLTRETTAKTKTFDVTLLPGLNTFRATAFNKDRTESNPAEIKIELRAAEASSDLYILAIGLNEYKNTRYNLNYGRADAQAFADAVEQHGHGIFKQINKRVIFDADATRVNIEAAFTEIIKQARPQDAFVFYYAGHGVMSESDDKNPADFYLVPYEVVRIYGDDGSLRTNGIAARNLRELLKNVRAQKQLIILDACESGGAIETIAMRGASEEKAIMQLARSAGVAVLASAGQDQVATEFGKLGHGVFTYALLKGLSGEADGAPRDGKITIKELEAYINDQVPELTKLYRGKRQDPNSWTRGQDFPIAIR
ncbi:MAG TPA: caspase family protein, partial [Pyrinomonadaceae bacterium]|nr:caspase family protein [Pyrinomonadaceae bacterium]